jgi:hypothetical protein
VVLETDVEVYMPVHGWWPFAYVHTLSQRADRSLQWVLSCDMIQLDSQSGPGNAYLERRWHPRSMTFRVQNRSKVAQCENYHVVVVVSTK